MFKSVAEYNSMLRQTLDSEDFRLIESVELEPFYTDDFLPEGLVHLRITDKEKVVRHFVFCQANLAEEIVAESEHQSYLANSHEILALLDDSSPKRMLQTAERFLKDFVS